MQSLSFDVIQERSLKEIFRENKERMQKMKAADMRIKMVEDQEAHERELDKQMKQRKIELDKERRR